MTSATISPADRDWQADQDLRTLIDAEKIKGDPKRLKPAMKKKREMKKALDNVDAGK